MRGFIYLYKTSPYFKRLILISGILFVLKIIIANTLGLGIDEVYYRLYALYPALSHFDHPAGVGVLIQLTTFNMQIDSEMAIRMGGILLSFFNIFIVYKTGKLIKDKRTGYYASLLYIGSVYASVISGLFVMPDTSLSTFWLLAIYFLLKSLIPNEINRQVGKYFLLFSLCTGLGFLSKYSIVFLWGGAFLYIISFRKNRLRTMYFWMAVLVFVLFTLPVIIWNAQNEWINFVFHSGRVGVSKGITLDYFAREIFGQLFYNNIFNTIIIATAFVHLFKKTKYLLSPILWLLLLTSLPLILFFIGNSLFKETLPHWSAPAWYQLIYIGAAYLSSKHSTRQMIYTPPVLKASLILLLVLLVYGGIEVRYGFFSNKLHSNKENILPQDLGQGDPTLDLYGWDQLQDKFTYWWQKKYLPSTTNPANIVISHKWFPAAHIDKYVATPNKLTLLCIGKLDEIHKYAWINKERKQLKKGEEVLFIDVSPYTLGSVKERYRQKFKNIRLLETIPIYRRQQKVKNVFIYRMECDNGASLML